MRDPQLELFVCLGALGGIDVSSFEGRLCLQKHVYLLQLFGVDLGYRFSWYLHGPYSPSLTEIAFEVERNRDTISERAKCAKLQPWAARLLHEYRDWVTRTRPADVSLAMWLEILASLHYLRHITPRLRTSETTKEKVVHDLLSRKPALDKYRKVIEAAWSALEDVGLTDKKTRQEKTRRGDMGSG